MSRRPGTSYQIEIHFAVVNHLYLLFSFLKLVETLKLSLIKKIISLPEILKQTKLYFMRNLIICIEKWISISQLVSVLFRVQINWPREKCHKIIISIRISASMTSISQHSGNTSKLQQHPPPTTHPSPSNPRCCAHRSLPPWEKV